VLVLILAGTVRHGPNRDGVGLGQDMNSRVLACAVLLGSQVLLCGAVPMGDQSRSQEPPLSPEGEPVMNDPETAAYCLSKARELGAKLDETPDTAGYFRWTLGTPLVSQNETWGIVCRIDFIMAGQDVAPHVNRLVLYVDAQKMNYMIAIGQDIPPLPPR
jgi:hypothetical protein